MQGHTMRVKDVAPFHPDVLHPALRPTIYCPKARVEACLSAHGRRTTLQEET